MRSERLFFKVAIERMRHKDCPYTLPKDAQIDAEQLSCHLQSEPKSGGADHGPGARAAEELSDNAFNIGSL
jgi:hypothetical protein